MVSFCEFSGVIFGLIAAALLFLSVTANRPLRSILLEETRKERLAEDHARTAMQTNLATLQQGASDAMAEQQQVEKDLAKQQERAATAERALLELQERIKDRHLTAEQQMRLIQSLSNLPKGQLEIRCPVGNPEAHTLSLELMEAFKISGWDTTLNDRVLIMPTPVGIKLWVHTEQANAPEGTAMMVNAPERSGSILKAFEYAHLGIESQITPSVPLGEVVIVVGFKP